MQSNTTTTTVEQITYSGMGVFNSPATHDIADSGSNEYAYNIKITGYGSISGIDYTIPPHSKGTVTAKLKMKALTSADIKDLNDLAMGMLNASQREEVKKHSETSASADLSVWAWFFGGSASASYKETRDEMKSKGLTDEQISTLINAFVKVAAEMSTVEAVVEIDNRNGDFPVSGNMYFYTISGQVTTGKETYSYQMISDKGNAGAKPGEGGAPADADIIPFN